MTTSSSSASGIEISLEERSIISTCGAMSSTFVSTFASASTTKSFFNSNKGSGSLSSNISSCTSSGSVGNTGNEISLLILSQLPVFLFRRVPFGQRFALVVTTSFAIATGSFISGSTNIFSVSTSSGYLSIGRICDANSCNPSIGYTIFNDSSGICNKV